MGLFHLAFNQPETYKAYRAFYQAEDKARLLAGIVLWSIAYGIFIFFDYQLFGLSQRLFSLLLVRLGYIGFSALCLVLLKVRTRDWQSFDRLAMVWGLVSALLTLTIYGFRQPIQEHVFLFDLVGCLSFFIFITNRLETQIIPVLIFTSFELMLVCIFRDAFPEALVRTVFFTFLGICLTGIFFALHFFRARRRAFLDYQEDARVRIELQRLASTDSLTGALNRRRLLELATDAFYRFKRYGRPFSLVLMDLDGFKRINDTFGHQQGDATLVEFSQIVQSEKRASDALGRMGGDEFCLVLPETSTQAAIHLAERILPRCREIDMTMNGAFLIGLTVSIGISQVTAQDDSLDSLFARADAALYQAKNNGRNCWKVL